MLHAKAGLNNMKVIHRIHVLKKLSTLKRSCFSANFALKHSWFCAETLLLSIYTCIYLYKNTCIRGTTAVNNFFVNPFLAVIVSISLTGCHRTIFVCDKPVSRINVRQIPATKTHPAQFYLCGNAQYPCSTIRNRNHVHQPHSIISSRHQQKRECHEKSIAKKNCVCK